MSLGRLALAAALLHACGGSGSSPGDAGPLDAGEDAAADAEVDAGPAVPMAAAEPMPAALPTFGPCPPGWRAVADPDDAALVVCDPWPEGGPRECPDDQAHFPGGAGCERIGTACPAGDFAEDLPADAEIVYVHPAAKPGGDGTRNNPLATIAEALAVAPPGAIVALARGTHEEAVDSSAAVTLWGACVAETVIAPSGPVSNGCRNGCTLRLSGAFRGARNLTVTGPTHGILVDDGAEGVVLESVVVRDVGGVGISVGLGALLTANDLVVRDVPSDFLGLHADIDAGVVLARAAFERAGFLAIEAAAADLDASDLAVRGSLPAPPEWPTVAMFLQSTFVSFARVVLDDNAGDGIFLTGLASLKATDLVVEGSEAHRALGLGVYASSADIELTRARVDRSVGVGVLVELGNATLEDVLVRDTRPLGAGWPFGHGIEIVESSTVEMIRVAVLESRGAGVLQDGGGSLSAGSDLVIRGTHGDSIDAVSPVFGSGVAVSGGRMDLRRVSIERSDVCGVHASAGAVLAASDLEVSSGGEGVPDGEYGQGLCASGGAEVELRRARLTENRTAALDLRGEGTVLAGTDVALADTAAQSSSGRFGAGALVLDGASLALERVLIERNRLAGVLTQGPGSRSSLTDAVVDGTRTQDCASTSCPGEPGGIGLAVSDEGSLEATRFQASDASACGVLVAARGLMDLHEGWIRSNPVGACVPDGEFDPVRLQDRVRYLDNLVDLDTAATFVPDGTSSSPPH